MKKLIFALAVAFLLPAAANADVQLTHTWTANEIALDANAPISDMFALGRVISIDSVEINISHSFAADIDFTLSGPGGVFDLTDDLGGSRNLGDGGGGDLVGLSRYVFVDSAGPMGGNGDWDGTAPADPIPGGTYDAITWQAGPIVAGMWTLTIDDDAGGDDGAVSTVVVTYTVPEPTSAMLLLAGFGIAAARRRR